VFFVAVKLEFVIVSKRQEVFLQVVLEMATHESERCPGLGHFKLVAAEISQRFWHLDLHALLSRFVEQLRAPIEMPLKRRDPFHHIDAMACY
jgi:hypothetical protein